MPGDVARARIPIAAGMLLLGGALLAPTFAPLDPSAQTGLPLELPTRTHLLGTNDVGQDLFSEWLWAAQASVTIALFVTLLSGGLSWSAGLAAGLVRGVEAPVLGLTDLLLALPSLPLYLLVVALTGPSRASLVLTLGLLSWPAFARIVRAQVLTLRGAPYVEAARALGAHPLRVGLVHVLPGTLHLVPAQLALTARLAIFGEATLAFLGLGDPSAKSWGTMLAWAFADPLLFARPGWEWRIVPPAAGVVVLVLALTWLAAAATSRGPAGTADR